MGVQKEIRVVAAVPVHPTKGSAGLATHLPGMSTTVSNIAEATGGIGKGKQIEKSINGK